MNCEDPRADPSDLSDAVKTYRNPRKCLEGETFHEIYREYRHVVFSLTRANGSYFGIEFKITKYCLTTYVYIYRITTVKYNISYISKFICLMFL